MLCSQTNLTIPATPVILFPLGQPVVLRVSVCLSAPLSSSGPGLSPFKAATGVRIPLGVLRRLQFRLQSLFYAFSIFMECSQLGVLATGSVPLGGCTVHLAEINFNFHIISLATIRRISSNKGFAAAEFLFVLWYNDAS